MLKIDCLDFQFSLVVMTHVKYILFQLRLKNL